MAVDPTVVEGIETTQSESGAAGEEEPQKMGNANGKNTAETETETPTAPDDEKRDTVESNVDVRWRDLPPIPPKRSPSRKSSIWSNSSANTNYMGRSSVGMESSVFLFP